MYDTTLCFNLFLVQEKAAFENIQIVPSKQVRSKYGAIMVWAGALESSKICFRIGDQISKHHMKP